MNDDKRKRMAELQRQSDDQDRQAEEREHQHAFELLDVALAPAADAVTASIIQLAEQLAELDLISEENPATPRWRVDVGDPYRPGHRHRGRSPGRWGPPLWLLQRCDRRYPAAGRRPLRARDAR
jgi:hypothetical protein